MNIGRTLVIALTMMGVSAAIGTGFSSSALAGCPPKCEGENDLAPAPPPLPPTR